MYSKLANVKLTVDGLEQTYTDISSKYDAISDQYTEMNSKVAEYKFAVDGFSANLTQVNTSLKNDYSTTTTMNTVIQEKIDALLLSVSQTYATQDVVLNATGRYTITFWAKASKAQTIAYDDEYIAETEKLIEEREEI